MAALRGVPLGHPPPVGENLGCETFEVQRQTLRPGGWRSGTGSCESAFEHQVERPFESAPDTAGLEVRMQVNSTSPALQQLFVRRRLRRASRHDGWAMDVAGSRIRQLRVGRDASGLI